MAGKRILREKKTIERMLKIYCKDKHGTKGELCTNCRELLDYALKRLDHCKFQDAKPACAKCSVHCYRQDMRGKIIDVMRYAGPRMLYRHPLLAVSHLIDLRRGTRHGS